MRRREWVSYGFAAAGCATAIFAVGGAFSWAQAIVGALFAVALIPQIRSRRVLSRVSPLVACLGVAVVLTLLSLAPLPDALRSALDPEGAALREDGMRLLEVSTWPCLTRDVAGTLHSLSILVVLFGVAMFAVRTSASERGRYRILGGVALLCGLTALVVGVHELVGAKSLYGIYTVKHARPNVLGPLLNENHLGGLMALGSCVAIGLALHRRQPSQLRAVWVAVGLACIGATAASGSRGALLALFAGAFVTAGLLLAQRLAPSDGKSSKRSFATSSLPIVIVALCAVVVVIYSSAGRVGQDLGRTSLGEVSSPRSKFAAWKSSEALLRETPWVGVGRGGFEASFTRIHGASGALTYAYLENEYLQAVVDWGIPGALALAAAMIWFTGTALRRWREGALTAGALGAVTAIAVQSTVDFGIQLLGLAVPVTLIAATVAYVPLRERASEQSAMPSMLRRIALVVALALAAVLLVLPATTTLKDDHEALAERRPETLDDLRPVAKRHPLDYFVYALASELESRAGHKEAISLLNHAMTLHPTHADLHRMAARLLYRGGYKDQAAIEYAAALRATPEARPLLAEIVSRFPANVAAEAIPPDVTDPGAMVRVLSELEHDDVSSLWLKRVLAVRPHDVGICNFIFEFSLSRRDLHTAELAGRHCLELLPDHQTRLALANLLATQSAHTEVIGLLRDVDTWHGRVDDKAAGWLLLCDSYVALERLDDARTCLRRLDASGLVAPEKRFEVTNRLERLDQLRRAKDLSGSGAGSAH